MLGSINSAGAGLMTTLGVLGTFTGIFIGLLDFNVAQIDASVPKLLDGMKIAFATSIVGMGAAITFRLASAALPEPTDVTTDATPEDILATLQSINDSVDKSTKAQTDALAEVRKAISSDGDSSLLTQMQKLRSTFQDGQDELIEEFRDFAKTMAEQNSKALIEALEGVIRDFNTKLNEQFGENFKQLNEAVGALLTWQENYKTHVETLEARIEAAVDALEDTRGAIEEISSSTKTIPETLEPMRPLLTGLQASVQNLEAHLQAVADLRDKAVEAFPVIESNIEKITNSFEASVSKATETMRSSVEEQTQSFDKLRTGYDDLHKSTEQSRDTFRSALADALTTMQLSIDKAMDGHAKTIDASTQALSEQVRASWEESQKQLNSQFEAFDQQMQQELTRALEAMGQRLAALSEKFVSDYNPLTDRLREVVRMAEDTR